MKKIEEVKKALESLGWVCYTWLDKREVVGSLPTGSTILICEAL